MLGHSPRHCISIQRHHILRLRRRILQRRPPLVVVAFVDDVAQWYPGALHRPDAAGYVFWSDRVIELDAINPQVAARLARALDRWSKLAEPYRSAAREAIARVAARPDLSKDTHEVVTRALAA